jgi:hypothetical protein
MALPDRVPRPLDVPEPVPSAVPVTEPHTTDFVPDPGEWPLPPRDFGYGLEVNP